jgi:hypothetical protein
LFWMGQSASMHSQSLRQTKLGAFVWTLACLLHSESAYGMNARQSFCLILIWQMSFARVNAMATAAIANTRKKPI